MVKSPNDIRTPQNFRHLLGKMRQSFRTPEHGHHVSHLMKNKKYQAINKQEVEILSYDPPWKGNDFAWDPKAPVDESSHVANWSFSRHENTVDSLVMNLIIYIIHIHGKYRAKDTWQTEVALSRRRSRTIIRLGSPFAVSTSSLQKKEKRPRRQKVKSNGFRCEYELMRIYAPQNIPAGGCLRRVALISLLRYVSLRHWR